MNPRASGRESSALSYDHGATESSNKKIVTFKLVATYHHCSNLFIIISGLLKFTKFVELYFLYYNSLGYLNTK